MRKLTCMQLQNTYKKAQRNFLQTTRKPEINLILFFAVLKISFVFLSTLAELVDKSRKEIFKTVIKRIKIISGFLVVL